MKKILAMALALMVTVSMAGCGGSNGSGSSGSSDSGSAEKGGEVASGVDDGVLTLITGHRPMIPMVPYRLKTQTNMPMAMM